jgi:hypothetical protein
MPLVNSLLSVVLANETGSADMMLGDYFVVNVTP